MDDLAAGGVPPGMVVWIDAPGYRFEGASGSADLTYDTPMPPEGAFRIGSITNMFTAGRSGLRVDTWYYCDRIGALFVAKWQQRAT